MTEPITWTNEQRPLRELTPWAHNPRRIARAEAERLEESLIEFGQVHPICIEPDGQICDGHQRQAVWQMSERFGPDYVVDVRVASRPLSERERQKLTVYLHRGAHGTWDFDIMADTFDLDDLLDWGFEEHELGLYDVPGAAPSLDELADEYGDPEQRDLWPFIRVQVSPGTHELYESLMAQLPGEDDAYKMEQILGAVDATVLGTVLS